MDSVAAPLVCKPIETEKLAVAMPPDHPLGRKSSVYISDLAEEPLITCPREISPTYFDAILGQFKAAKAQFNAPHSARSISSQIAMVACGVGLAIVPQSFMDFETRAVTYRVLEDSVKVTTTAAVWNTERPTEIIEEFISLVEPAQ